MRAGRPMGARSSSCGGSRPGSAAGGGGGNRVGRPRPGGAAAARSRLPRLRDHHRRHRRGRAQTGRRRPSRPRRGGQPLPRGRSAGRRRGHRAAAAVARGRCDRPGAAARPGRPRSGRPRSDRRHRPGDRLRGQARDVPFQRSRVRRARGDRRGPGRPAVPGGGVPAGPAAAGDDRVLVPGRLAIPRAGPRSDRHLLRRGRGGRVRGGPRPRSPPPGRRRSAACSRPARPVPSGPRP
jgi:hypothetical protein